MNRSENSVVIRLVLESSEPIGGAFTKLEVRWEGAWERLLTLFTMVGAKENVKSTVPSALGQCGGNNEATFCKE